MESNVFLRGGWGRVLVVLAVLGSEACALPTRPSHSFEHGISAAEVAATGRAADIVATATMEDVRYESYPDMMDGTIVWKVLRCHAGRCSVGAQLKTRFSGAFSTSGEFCALQYGCLKRDSLKNYVGDRFLVAFTRASYVAQVGAREGIPRDGYFSLNRGYYLLKGDALYSNDRHRLVDASYEAATTLLTKE